MNKFNAFFNDKKGTVAIELSMLFPLLIPIVLGFLMYMNGIVMQIGMGVAAREGAREFANSHYDVYAIEATEYILGMNGLEDVQITTISSGTDRGIIVRKPYKIHVPFIGTYDYTLERTAIFYTEPLYEN